MRPTSLTSEKNLSILREHGIADYDELIKRVFHQTMESFQRRVRRSGLPSSRHGDVLSDLWEAAVEGIHTAQYNCDEHPIITASRWLHGVCSNKISDQWRALEKEGTLRKQAAQAMNKAAHPQSDFLEEIQDIQVYILEKALQSLKPRHRKLITAIHLEGRSYRDLQKELGGTVNQLKSCCYYARRKWREKVIQLARRELLITPECDELKVLIERLK